MGNSTRIWLGWTRHLQVGIKKWSHVCIVFKSTLTSDHPSLFKIFIVDIVIYIFASPSQLMHVILFYYFMSFQPFPASLSLSPSPLFESSLLLSLGVWSSGSMPLRWRRDWTVTQRWVSPSHSDLRVPLSNRRRHGFVMNLVDLRLGFNDFN